MQVVRSLLLQARGEGGVREDVGALALGHGCEHIHALIDGVGGAQLDGGNVLVDEREITCEIEKILVLRTVTDNGGGELLSAVYRIVQGKCDARIFHADPCGIFPL